MDSDFAKTICSICYEELKPIVEDLQSISICGHVFHELCLQQWFEYCSNSKKHSCPVCKQSCKGNDACRLYFQSVGDVKDATLPQRSVDFEENAAILRNEVRRLEVKVLGLSSTLESQGKELKALTEELCTCKEQAKLEAALKNEALKQKSSLQQLLTIRSQELDKSTSECSKLQDRNMALAKELAALKLVSDLDLDEEEVLKLAALGGGANSKDTLDILRKSLILRNRSYKELMAKCNLLGRGEARYSRKLEKAKLKISKLKERVKELELTVEVKDNEILRSLKVAKRTRSEGADENCVNTNSSLADNLSLKDQVELLAAPIPSTKETGNMITVPSDSVKIEKLNLTKNMVMSLSKDSRTSTFTDVESGDSKYLTSFFGIGEHVPQYKYDYDVTEKTLSKSEAPPNVKQETTVNILDSIAEPGPCNFRTSSKSETGETLVNGLDDDVMTLDAEEFHPVFNIKKDNPFQSGLLEPGDVCFSGGLLGPDGSHRYLGKWCKRGYEKGSTKSSKTFNSGLIAGENGRHGRIKLLRSPKKPLPDDSLVAKRFKIGPKTIGYHSQGCLQIEHFFARSHH